MRQVSLSSFVERDLRTTVPVNWNLCASRIPNTGEGARVCAGWQASCLWQTRPQARHLLSRRTAPSKSEAEPTKLDLEDGNRHESVAKMSLDSH
jgi:hypothetical protein